MKLSLRLFSAAAFAPLASADYETLFTFKDDFFYKICGLPVGMGPSDAAALIGGFDDKAEEFKIIWADKIKELQGGECEVAGDFPDPDFTVCDYKHPEKYDVYRLPLAGQCYVDEDCYVQRLFVKIKDLKVRCPEQLTMEELDWPTLLSDALEILEPKDFPGLGTVETVDELSSSLCDSNSICNALLSINRYMNINVDLSCLKDVYGTAQAAELTVALDSYFEQFIVPKIEKTVETVCPTSSAYSVKSPFSSDGDVEFCYYPASYADGTIADQYVAGDGNIVTTFKCAFDLVWFKDKNCSDSLLPDFVTSVQEAFQEDSPSFLTFLQEMYSTETWVQPITSCGVIDPNNIDIDSPNPTQSPTQSPTSVPTTSPTDGPTAAPIQSPTTSPSESSTDTPSSSAAPSSPTDTHSPSQSPTTGAPTTSPTPAPSGSPSKAPTASPVASPTRNPTNAPTTSPVVSTLITTPIDDCRIETNVTEEETPYVKVGTCGNGNKGDGVCAAEGECCSEWGWCGYTEEHCGNGAPSATPAVDPFAGKCGDGKQGDGTCLGKNECCSEYGYCGEGDQYCFTQTNTDTNESSLGKCGGGDAGEGLCFNKEDCCSQYGFCGKTEEYCNAVQPRVEPITDTSTIDDSFLPDDLQAEFGFRCGITETDARSNCKPKCNHRVQCNKGEECWGVQLNYCNTFEEGTHPICTDLTLANTVSRCGFDETSARGFCGSTCESNDDCPGGEICFPVLENLCDCNLEIVKNQKAPANSGNEATSDDETTPGNQTSSAQDNTTDAGDWNGDDYSSDENPFTFAKAKIEPYFVKQFGEGNVEGYRDNASSQMNMAVTLIVIASMNFLFSCFV